MTLKSSLKKVVQSAGLLGAARGVRRALLRVAGLRHPIQDLATSPSYSLVRLGSDGCGWTIFDDPALHGGIIISAGLGEDASFDVELASKYHAVVHIVDPTPRAIEHFGLIGARLGLPETAPYSSGGIQPAEAYDLSKVSADTLKLHKVALWNQNGTVKFFLPKKSENVSHSIINFQHAYSDQTPFIEVEALTLSSLFERMGVAAEDVVLLKLDIEGAEIEVLEEAVKIGFLPHQILVEFDELNFASKRGFSRVSRIYERLTSAGYRMIHTNGEADFLFVRVPPDYAD